MSNGNKDAWNYLCGRYDDDDVTMPIDFDISDWLKDVLEPRVERSKCDCGSEKTYGPGTTAHSSWCSWHKTVVRGF